MLVLCHPHHLQADTPYVGLTPSGDLSDHAKDLFDEAKGGLEKKREEEPKGEDGGMWVSEDPGERKRNRVVKRYWRGGKPWVIFVWRNTVFKEWKGCLEAEPAREGDRGVVGRKFP